jgi:hypothetical protein
MGPIAAVRLISKPRHQRGSNRIHMEVAAQLQTIAVPVNHDRLVSPLEQMAASSSLPVELIARPSRATIAPMNVPCQSLTPLTRQHILDGRFQRLAARLVSARWVDRARRSLFWGVNSVWPELMPPKASRRELVAGHARRPHRLHLPFVLASFGDLCNPAWQTKFLRLALMKQGVPVAA